MSEHFQFLHTCSEVSAGASPLRSRENIKKGEALLLPLSNYFFTELKTLVSLLK